MLWIWLDQRKEKFTRELEVKMSRVKGNEAWKKNIVCANIDNPHCPVRVMWDAA